MCSNLKDTCVSVGTFRKRCNASVALALTLAAASTWAHHSATQYDHTRHVTLAGTLTKVDWRNPHIEFSLEANENDGQTRSWLIESNPPNRFARRDINKAVFENAIGQTVTVVANPEQDGSPFGILVKITFPDGSVVNCERQVSGNCTWEPLSQR